MDQLLEFFLYTQGPVPYFLAFMILLMCGLGLPIPEDITLFVMGILSFYGLTEVWLSIFVCFFGVMLGDVLIYLIGRAYGTKLTKKGLFSKIIPPERLAKARELFHKRGNKVIFIARFLPGLRAPTYFSAGALHLPLKVFLFYDGLAAIVSVPILVYSTYFFGEKVDYVIRIARKVQHGIVFTIVGILILFFLKRYISNFYSKLSKRV